MYNLTFKHKYNYVIFFLLASVITCVSFFYYERFKEIHLPVFDAVMNEKNQFLSYLRFKNDYTLMNRINQLIYEFLGNPLSAGFGCLIAFFAPKWFANDTDIFIRSLFSIFIFITVLYKYLVLYKLKMIDFILIVLLIFSVQFIHNPENGINTYIPEISAGLFLMSGFISLMIFSKIKNIKWLFVGVFLMLISIIFRFNFFVYVAFFFLPFTRLIISCLLSKTKKTRLKIAIFFLFIFLLVFFYINQHFSFFLGYYAKPVAYQSYTITECFLFFFQFCKYNIGLYGFFAYLSIFLIYQNAIKSEHVKLNLIVVYPILFIILFLFLKMKATQPHIYSLIIIMAIVFLFINLKIVTLNIKITRVISVIVLVMSIFSFDNLNEKIQIITPKEKADLEIAKFLQTQISDKPIQFVCFHREQLEIPLQVYFFRKTKIMMDQKLKFFFHDWNFYDIDSNLSINRLTKYYSDNIKKTIDFVVINKKLNSDFNNFRTASLINRSIYSLLLQKNKFQQIKVINKNSFNELIIFKVIRNEKR